MAKLLPENFLPSDMTGYGLYIEVGVFREFDIDNTLKSLIDALQQAYGFNDNQIDYLYAKKKIVRNFDPSGPGDRSKDYIKISLVEAVEFEISADHIVWEPEEPSVLKKLDDYVQDDKWAFHASGRNVKWDKFSES